MKDIEGAIRSFLDLAEHKSLLIRGDWGTGKTYLARKVLSEKHSDSHLFVSLYGLKSREELDLAVAAQAIARAPRQKFIRDKSRHVNELLRILRIERLAAHVAKETIKSNIVCFDDIERKDDDLSIQTIVSYIDGLNNSYDTKTICIINTDRLSETEQDWLRENAEKTFGKRIRVEPPLSHIREIAIGTVDVFDAPIANLLEAFNVTNIRIAIEISQNCRAFLSSVGESERKLENDELRVRLTTVAAATASLSGLRDFPAPDFLRETMDRNRFDLSEDPAGNDEGWRGVLSELGYRTTDRFDHLLINQIDRGYFSRDEIEAHFREIATGVSSGSQTKYSAAWREYHDGIDDDTEGFVQRFFDGALESLASIESHNMNGSVKLLNYLGESDKAKELALRYVRAHKGEGPYFFDVRAEPFMSASEIDATFAAAMNMGLASEIASMDLAKTLDDVANSESVGDYQATRLSTLSAPELKAAILTMSESKRWNAIRVCLTAARHNTESVERLKIETVTREMVKELALGSTLNRVRIERKFNLKFPSDQSR